MGVNGETGIAGLTLAAASERLAANTVLSCDTFISAEMVTRRRLLHVSAKKHAICSGRSRGGRGKLWTRHVISNTAVSGARHVAGRSASLRSAQQTQCDSTAFASSAPDELSRIGTFELP